MNVAAILNQKGRAVTTARPIMTLMEVANKLAAKRIGAIVIVGARGEVAGIISAARFAEHDQEGRYLSGDGHSRGADGNDDCAAVPYVPVMADDALVGIISIGDIVKHHVAEVVMEATAMREYITHS